MADLILSVYIVMSIRILASSSLASVLLFRGIRPPDYQKLVLATGFLIGSIASVSFMLTEISGVRFLNSASSGIGIASTYSWIIVLLMLVNAKHQRFWFYTSLAVGSLSLLGASFLPMLIIRMLTMSFALASIGGFLFLYIKVRHPSLVLTVLAIALFIAGALMIPFYGLITIGLTGIPGYVLLFIAFEYGTFRQTKGRGQPKYVYEPS